MKQWSKAVVSRTQCVLFSETLDDSVREDHPIRYLDTALDLVDWSCWEGEYSGYRGQPAIHPKLMAGAILYGLMKRIRSTRDLEEATRERLDFRWFLECRTIDHSTFGNFRKRFDKPLKDLMKQISRAVVERSEEPKLLELILDGTRIRANSERQGSRTAQQLERLVQACCQALEEKLDRFECANESEEEIQELRRKITELEREREKYELALSEARCRDEIRRKHNGEKSAGVKVPVTDRDATVLPNKDGGYAPNYTPTVGVESESGAIVSADVVEGGDEASSVVDAAEDCQEVLGQLPEQILADGNFATGASLEQLEGKGIDSYMPTGTAMREDNPANRPDPSQPVAKQLWERLPRHGKQLDRRAFVYVAEEDQYRCPMGRSLVCKRQGKHTRTKVRIRYYYGTNCAECPLASQCISGKAKSRCVTRDEYQDVRDRVDERMTSPEGRVTYSRRAPRVEVVFARIKQSFAIRQFLLRGIKNVRIEWTWLCTAYNLKKLLALMQKDKRVPKGRFDAQFRSVASILALFCQNSRQYSRKSGLAEKFAA